MKADDLGRRAGLRFLKKLVEGAAGVVSIARRGGAPIIHGRWRRRVGRAFARYGDPRCEEGTLVGFILVGNAYRNWLEALETGGWLEVRTLFAAVQLGVALGTSASEVGPRRERGGAVVTTGCGHVLDQTRQPGAGYIEGRPRPLGLGPVSAWAPTVAVRVHVPVLSILAITVHGEGCSVDCRPMNVSGKTDFDPQRLDAQDTALSPRQPHKTGRRHFAWDGQFGVSAGFPWCRTLLIRDPPKCQTNIYHGLSQFARPSFELAR
jgi:hypothetical protein